MVKRSILALAFVLGCEVASADGVVPNIDFTMAGGISHVIASGYGSNSYIFVNEIVLGPSYGTGAIRLHILGAGLRQIDGFGLALPYGTLVAHDKWKFVPKGLSFGIGKLPSWPGSSLGRKGIYSFLGVAK